MQTVTPVLAVRQSDWVELAVTSSWGGAGALFENTTDSTFVTLRNIGEWPLEYQVDSGAWTLLEPRISVHFDDVSLATTTFHLRKGVLNFVTAARFEIDSLTGEYSVDDRPVSLGGDGGPVGSVAFEDLTDAATADLPNINTPLFDALAALAPLSVVPVPLTDDTTISTDATNACNFRVELTGADHLLDNPTAGLRDGQTYTWRIDNPSGFAMSFGSMFKWDGGTAPTLATGRNLVCAIYYADINELHSAAGLDKR